MPIIEEFETRQDFLSHLEKVASPDNNINGTIVKFTAEWCAPCKTIKDYVGKLFDELPPTIQCCNLDVDDNFDLYAIMKRLKQLSGIPTIMYFKKGNVSYIPNLTVAGTITAEIDNLFATAIKNCAN